VKSPIHRAERGLAPRSQLSQFAQFVTQRSGNRFDDYASFHAFSVSELELFWALFLEWSGARVSGETEPVCDGSGIEGTRFFPRLRLSWAENLLAERSPEEERAAAIVGCDETGARAELTRADLRRRVRAIAAGLEARGLGPGDRVVAIARNTIDSIVACLAVTSLGATWSSIAPDMGLDAALARFRPLAPKMLLSHRSTRMHGARVDVPLHDVARALASLEAIVTLDASGGDGGPRAGGMDAIGLERIEQAGRGLPAADPSAPWRRFAFDHPLFVLFSSGTTGAPKCIVHGHGGALVEHLKEHRLHCDLGPADRICFQTSAGWMMWNWTLSALAAGARVVTYDGSVSYPSRDSLLEVVEREGVTVLGISPAYLQYLVDAGVTSAPERLRGLRSILSTGSVLSARLHRWAKSSVVDVPLESISGGTDILGCFVMGSPWTDTYEGESSCIGLGLDVRAWSEAGGGSEGTGELVCARPFPSRPVGFFGDPGGARLHAAYYAQHEGVWTHGDLVEMTPRGTVRVLGRCDGVLNVRGIRIGPSEIYDVVSSAVPEVAHALAVDADAPEEPGGKRLVLYVVLRPGRTLDRPLALRIKKTLKERASPAHVPAAVVAVEELPVTFSGKIAEAAMQDALNGRPVRNLAALRNPRAIEWAIAALRAVDGGRPARSSHAAAGRDSSPGE
jgi:acetoacetyl-CoA synthetase